VNVAGQGDGDPDYDWQDETMSRYDLYVTRQSADATLSRLPEYRFAAFLYSILHSKTTPKQLHRPVTAVRVKPTVNDVHATLTVNGKASSIRNAIASHCPYHGGQYDQHGGNGRYGNTRTYTIVVTRAAGHL